MPEQEHPFQDQTSVTDTLPRLVATGSLALNSDPKKVVEALPGGMRVVLEVRVYSTDSWSFRSADGGTPVPGPQDVWFTLYGVNIHELLRFTSNSGATLYYVLNGK